MREHLYYLMFVKDPDWAGVEGINDDLLQASLCSLRRNSSTGIHLYTTEDTVISSSSDVFGCYIHRIPRACWDGRRMLCRLENLLSFLKENPNALVLSSEADEFFLEDPFQFFRDSFDIGIGSRMKGAKIPVNTGLVFIRNSPEVIVFLDWAISQISSPAWDVYKQLSHKKSTSDVYCDRDLWWAAWEDRKFIKSQFGLQVSLVDAGYLFEHALSGKQCSFHLKGKSKDLIYTKEFKELVHERENRTAIS